MASPPPPVAPGLFGLLLRGIGLPLVLVFVGALVLAPLLSLGQTDQADDPALRPVTGDAPTPLVNLAAAALFRAGFLRLADPETDGGEAGADEPSGPGPATQSRPGWTMTALPQVACSRDPLVGAIVAAEVYNRPASRRALETSLAQMLRSLTGLWPDWSYGMGQIRLSTAREAIAGADARVSAWFGADVAVAPPDDEIMQSLLDLCENLAMVGLVLDGLGKPEDGPGKRAALYRGGKGRATLPGVVGYEEVVSVMADILANARAEGGAYNTPIDQLAVPAGEATVAVESLPAAQMAGPDVPLICLDHFDEATAWSVTVYRQQDPVAEVARGDTAGSLPESGTVPLAAAEAALLALEAPATDLRLRPPHDFEENPPWSSGLDRLVLLSSALAAVPGLDVRPWRSRGLLPAAKDVDLCQFGLLLVAPGLGARAREAWSAALSDATDGPF